MLEKYGKKITSLYGPDPGFKWQVLAMFSVQFATMYFVRNASWSVLLFFAYVVGGTINHSLSLAVHELSHGLGFKKRWVNVLWGMLSNIPQGLPTSATFKVYHLEHHQFQGVQGLDMDVPTQLEAMIFRGVLGKLAFVILQPFTYSLRPLLCRRRAPSSPEILNVAFIALCDLIVWSLFGGKALSYLVIGTFLGMGLHPCAGHFIAEHYVFMKGHETYSYYGPLNALTFNVGYHNEHHDFPHIPGRRLPELRKIAPEFYETLPHYNSWVGVLWNFITDPTITPFARIKRMPEHNKLLRQRAA